MRPIIKVLVLTVVLATTGIVSAGFGAVLYALWCGVHGPASGLCAGGLAAVCTVYLSALGYDTGRAVVELLWGDRP